jgi:uroporphyrin-III C-methyltransferase
VSSGRVWLVGAGPGDAELITVKGRRLLEQADAVVHDRLVGAGVLALIPEGVLRIDMGKAGYGPATSQAAIHRTLIRLARAGLDVVRLKGGDPFVFGRGGEEVEALREAGISCEVVPGVTAGIAGPGLAGIPVTHRGTARSVAFVSAPSAADAADAAGVDWTALAGIETVVVYMAGRLAGRVARRLIDAGRAGATPAALILDASLDSVGVHVTDLASLAAGADGPPPEGRATLLVVGEVVALRAGTGDDAHRSAATSATAGAEDAVRVGT